jgi:hypothetical protein
MPANAAYVILFGFSVEPTSQTKRSAGWSGPLWAKSIRVSSTVIDIVENWPVGISGGSTYSPVERSFILSSS